MRVDHLPASPTFALSQVHPASPPTRCTSLAGRASRNVTVNHQSNLDLLVSAALTPVAPIAIGKRELMFVPVVNLFFWATHSPMIRRTASRKTLDALSDVVQRVRDERRSLFIAPEGTRTPDARAARETDSLGGCTRHGYEASQGQGRQGAAGPGVALSRAGDVRYLHHVRTTSEKENGLEDKNETRTIRCTLL